MRRFAASVLSAAIFMCAAASMPALQSPPPSAGKSDRNPKPQSTPSDQNTNSDESRTQNNPFVVKIAPSPEAQPETDDQRKGRQEKASEDWWGLIFVGLTALFTGFLVGVGGGQLYMFYKQLGLIRDGMRDATIASESARDAARAAALHARAVVALESPLLRVTPSAPISLRDVQILIAREARGETVTGQIPKFCIINYLTVHNAGRTAATPVKIRFGTTVTDQLIEEPAYTVSLPAEAHGLIPPSAAQGPPSGVAAGLDHISALSDEDVTRLQMPGIFFWMYLEITYLDFMDNHHEARFCWRWESDGTRGWRWVSRFDVPPAYLRKVTRGSEK